MFESTCCKPSVSLDHRMRYLKLSTSGKAKGTLDECRYLGVHFNEAFALLQKRFGAPRFIVGAQIEKLSKHLQVKVHNYASIIEFFQVVNSFFQSCQLRNVSLTCSLPAICLCLYPSCQLIFVKLGSDLLRNFR